MSTVKATNFQHPSASAAGITLGSDGSVVLPSGFTGGLGSNVVTAANLVSFTTSSTAFADVTDVTVTITPTSATSKVFVVVTGLLGHDDGNFTYVRLDRDGTDIALGSGGTVNQSHLSYQSGSTDYGQAFAISWLDSPATTSPVIYKLKAASSSGTGYVGRTGAVNYRVPTVITAIEVAA